MLMVNQPVGTLKDFEDDTLEEASGPPSVEKTPTEPEGSEWMHKDSDSQFDMD